MEVGIPELDREWQVLFNLVTITATTLTQRENILAQLSKTEMAILRALEGKDQHAKAMYEDIKDLYTELEGLYQRLEDQDE